MTNRQLAALAAIIAIAIIVSHLMDAPASNPSSHYKDAVCTDATNWQPGCFRTTK
jgi:hypothetical protein